VGVLGVGHICDKERGEPGAKFVEVANKITACDGIDEARGCNRGEGGFQVFGWSTLDEPLVDHIGGLAFVGVGQLVVEREKLFFDVNITDFEEKQEGAAEPVRRAFWDESSLRLQIKTIIFP